MKLFHLIIFYVIRNEIYTINIIAQIIKTRIGNLIALFYKPINPEQYSFGFLVFLHIE